MNLSEFLAFAATRRPLDTEEIGRFMDEMSDSARRITFELNGSYHTPDEVRALLSRLFGYEIDPSVRVFPPFYTDFGRNIAVGKGVFINACCHFQDHGGVTLGDGCQIGHNVVFATLDHGIAPAERRTTVPAPIVLAGTSGWVRTRQSCAASPSATMPSWRPVRSLRRTWRRIPSWEAFPPACSAVSTGSA